MIRFQRSFLCMALLVPATFAAAQDSKPAPKKPALTPAEADADFALQGEYSGEIVEEKGKRKFGVQVIALSGGKFRAVGYPGGLPGDGWEGEKKTEVEATRDGDRVLFKVEKGQGVLGNGLISIQDADGNELGKLKKVTRKSPTLGKKPPEGAVVLFDGKSADKFKNGRMTDDGLLMQGVTSKQTFGDFTLHMEFLLSYMPYARGQGRSNSGVYMQGRHEVQILDSFGLAGKAQRVRRHLHRERPGCQHVLAAAYVADLRRRFHRRPLRRKRQEDGPCANDGQTQRRNRSQGPRGSQVDDGRAGQGRSGAGADLHSKSQ